MHKITSAMTASPRSQRVVAAVALVVVLSTFDAVATLFAMTTIGMCEENLLAAGIAKKYGPLALLSFKVGTIAVFVAIILILRRRRSCEFAAYLAVTLMLLVMAFWVGYAVNTNGFGPEDIESFCPAENYVRL
jgi:uncharacterized membrane protein